MFTYRTRMCLVNFISLSMSARIWIIAVLWMLSPIWTDTANITRFMDIPLRLINKTNYNIFFDTNIN